MTQPYDYLVVSEYQGIGDPSTFSVYAENNKGSTIATGICGTDDITVLDAAISLGGTIYLSNGIFQGALDGSSKIHILSNTEIIGNVNTVLNDIALYIDSKTNIRLSSLEFTGDTTNETITITNSSDIYLKNIIASDLGASSSVAFYIYANSGNCQRIYLEDCQVLGGARFGFFLGGNYNIDDTIQDVHFTRCRAIECGKDSRGNDWVTGFDLCENPNTKNIYLTDCEASYCWESGFHQEGDAAQRNIQYLRCKAEYNGQKSGSSFGNGFTIAGNAKLLNCESNYNIKGINANTGSGYLLGYNNPTGASLINCNASNNGSRGITQNANSNDISIIGGQIEYNAEFGIVTAESERFNIEGVHLNYNHGGILANIAGNSRITGNIIYSNYYNPGIYLGEVCDGAMVSENEIYQNSITAIYVRGSNNFIYRNRCLPLDGYCIHLTTESYGNILDSNIINSLGNLDEGTGNKFNTSGDLTPDTAFDDSYVLTDAVLEDYIGSNPRTAATALKAASATDQEWYCQEATRIIDRLPLSGYQLDYGQDFQFPRKYEPNNPNSTSPWGEYINEDAYGYIYVSSDVPNDVIYACCEEAIALYAFMSDSDNTDRESMKDQGVSNYNLGGVYSESLSSSQKDRHFGLHSKEAYRLLQKYIDGSVKQV